VDATQATKTFRVRFDRNTYSIPWRLAQQPVVVRANDEVVAVYPETRQVALHRRCWDIGQDVKDDAHEAGLLEKKPRAARGVLPPELEPLGEVATRYFKVLAAGSRSLTRETVRLTLLAELFGDGPPPRRSRTSWPPATSAPSTSSTSCDTSVACGPRRTGLLHADLAVREKGDRHARVAEFLTRTMVLQVPRGVRAQVPEEGDLRVAPEEEAG
jgi:hypothetical protein